MTTNMKFFWAFVILTVGEAVATAALFYTKATGLLWFPNAIITLIGGLYAYCTRENEKLCEIIENQIDLMACEDAIGKHERGKTSTMTLDEVKKSLGLDKEKP